jgi:hypothetical protein
VYGLTDEPRKASREGRPAEPRTALQFARGPRPLGPFVDQLERLADVQFRNCTEPPALAGIREEANSSGHISKESSSATCISKELISSSGRIAKEPASSGRVSKEPISSGYLQPSSNRSDFPSKSAPVNRCRPAYFHFVEP